MKFQQFYIATAFGLLGFVLYTEPCVAADSQRFDSFSDLRHKVLNIISGATSRVWITTQYLTDGEIVSALYVARYRRLDVQVLLGRRRARSYMSRLNYLKNQKIPVFIKPETFKTSHATAVLSDNSLVFIDGELDFQARYRRFNLTQASADEIVQFARGFASAVQKKLPAIPRRRPLVGRSRAPRLTPPKPVYQKSDSDAYTYGTVKKPAPSGIPTQLPKATIWEKRVQDENEDDR